MNDPQSDPYTKANTQADEMRQMWEGHPDLDPLARAQPINIPTAAPFDWEEILEVRDSTIQSLRVDNEALRQKIIAGQQSVAYLAETLQRVTIRAESAEAALKDLQSAVVMDRGVGGDT